MTSSPDVPFYPMQRSWGQARSQEYRYLYSFLKDLDKIFSHEKKKKDAKYILQHPPRLLSSLWTLCNTCRCKTCSVNTSINYHSSINTGINYFISSFPLWFLIVPGIYIVASVVLSAPGKGYPSLLGSKKGSPLAPGTSLCPAAFSSDSCSGATHAKMEEGKSYHPVYVTAKKSFGNQRAERTWGH